MQQFIVKSNYILIISILWNIYSITTKRCPQNSKQWTFKVQPGTPFECLSFNRCNNYNCHFIFDDSECTPCSPWSTIMFLFPKRHEQASCRKIQLHKSVNNIAEWQQQWPWFHLKRCLQSPCCLFGPSAWEILSHQIKDTNLVADELSHRHKVWKTTLKHWCQLSVRLFAYWQC